MQQVVDIVGQVFVGGSGALLFQHGECFGEQDAAGGELFVLGLAVAVQAKTADEQRQAQPLTDERDQDDGEGEEQQKVPLQKRRSVAEGLRQAEGSGQCEYASHARPADDEDGARIGRGGGLAEDGAAYPRGGVRSGIDPGHAQRDEHQREGDAVEDQRADGVLLQAGDDVGKLQPYEQKDDAVQDEVERLPRAHDLQTGRGREVGRALATEVERADHDGEHAGATQALRTEVGEVRHDEADGHLHGAFSDPALKMGDEVAEQQANPDAASDQPQQP